MSDKGYPQDWKAWGELSEQQRRFAVADRDFWATLTPAQRSAFLEQAEWQDLRHVTQARDEKLAALRSMEQICEHLGLTSVQVYWLISTRKLPAWLVGGTWKFDERQVDGWVASMGGLGAVRKDVEDQIATHRAAQDGGAH